MLPHKEQVKHTVVVMLDALLDTRLGVVRKLYGDELANSILDTKQYRCKKNDDFTYIDHRVDPKKFAFEYLKRNTDLLDFSNRSMISVYLQQLIKKLQYVLDGFNPILKDIRIVVNHYPYVLNENEKTLIAAGINTTVGLAGSVSMEYIEPKDITLEYLEATGVFAFILYDFDEWSCAALPDKEVKSLSEAGLNRLENLTIVASRIAIDVKKEEEAINELKKYPLPFAIEDVSLIPWTLLFDLELIEPIFFTEYNQTLEKKLMSVIDKSSSPIDVEVSFMDDYYNLIKVANPPDKAIGIVLNDLDTCVSGIKNVMGNVNESNINDLRLRVAELRFLADSLAFAIPCKPAQDYERLIDSKMSCFDVSLENSEISEHNWNKKGVRCRRLIKDIKSIQRPAYFLVCAETITDSDGILRVKDSILPSCNAFDTILEKVDPEEIKEFIKLHGG